MVLWFYDLSNQCGQALRDDRRKTNIYIQKIIFIKQSVQIQRK